MNEDKNNKDFVDIYRKAENISSAVFLVSDTMSDGGELKTRVKDLALRLISDCSMLKGLSIGERIKNIHSLEAISLNIASLLQVASVSGIVSSMNSSVIREELQVFIKQLVFYSKSASEAAIILAKENAKNPEYGAVTTDQSIDQAASVPTKSQNGHLNGYSNGQAKVTRKDARERTIIEFIKTKDSVNIKDIARNVRGCSEKTIQRELLKMVESGLVRKTGERRWSRYSYVGN